MKAISKTQQQTRCGCNGTLNENGYCKRCFRKNQPQVESKQPIEYFLPSSLGFKFNYLEAQENFAEQLVEDLE